MEKFTNCRNEKCKNRYYLFRVSYGLYVCKKGYREEKDCIADKACKHDWDIDGCDPENGREFFICKKCGKAEDVYMV